MLFTFLAEVVRRTPVYVWVLLAVLISRGLSASKDNVLSFPRMFLFPAVFIIWGLEEVVAHFAFPGGSMLTYGVLAVMGTFGGYALYNRFRHCYQKEGVIYRSGTYMPMVVMMMNFIVKYALNVAMSINPGLYGSVGFNLFYAGICGCLVGLSIGGIFQAYRSAAGLALPG